VRTTEYWFKRLNECADANERCELAKITDCHELLHAFCQHDVEYSVVEAAMNNIYCKEESKKLGNERIDKLEIYIPKVPNFKGTFCPLPWNHISVQQNGDFRVCCQQIYPPFGKLKNSDNTVANILADDINQVRNHNFYKEIRLSMMKGERHESCQLCWKEEDNGLSSRRHHSIYTYGSEGFIENTNSDGSIDTNIFPIKYIDIRFGNLCNLKCRYCGPTDSSLWYEDHVILSRDDVNATEATMNYYGTKTYSIKKTNNVFKVDSLDFEWYESEKFWNMLEKLIPHIDRYYFTGGEPTINKTHFKCLEKIIEMGYSKKVQLDYNSNMFAIPDKLYKLWSHFKYVGIGASIDGINDLAYYLRTPSTWDVLEKNLDTYGYNEMKNIGGTISSTISVFNVLNFIDITRWLLNKKYKRFTKIITFHMLEGPKFMSVQVLPYEWKLFVKEKYEEFFTELDESVDREFGDYYRNHFDGIFNYMFAEDKSDLLPKLKEHTMKLDQLRNLNLDDYVPWLSKILKNV
jgi:sulfatase maturation enzyme AslB (radical SAM superfamily)